MKEIFKKHLIKIIIAVVVLALLIGGLLFYRFITGKTPIDADTFISVMEIRGYEIEDVTESFEQGIEVALIASKDNIEVFFIIYENERYAITNYNHLKNLFKNFMGNSSSTSTMNFSRWQRYKQRSGRSLAVVSRIENTIIYAVVEDSYRSEINNIIKEFNY